MAHRAVFSALAAVALQLPFSARATEPERCSARTSTLAEPGEKSPEIATDELQRVLADGSAVVLDARPVREFAVSHIPGARNVSAKPGQPMSAYVSDVAEVGRLVGGKKDAPLVLYCNGPFCGKSKRLAAELKAAGFTNVRRYQLGIPTWRALVGTTAIEPEGLRYVLENDRTAVLVDARAPEDVAKAPLPGARPIALADVEKAKDDGRLPMEDHNTRIVVVGKDAAQARAVAERIARNAFHNVSFFTGAWEQVAAR